MNTTLYYFTGTGNSLQIARYLQKELENCKLIPIAKEIHEKQPSSTTEKVGFVFPLHYYGLPKILYDFVSKIRLDSANYIFAVVTRAGDVDGVPFILLEKLLKKVSKNLSAGFFVMMPDNFILHPSAVSEEVNNEFLKKSKTKAKEISDFVKEKKKNLEIDIVEGKKYKYERGNLKFHKVVHQGDNSFFVDERCNSCGICEEVCPVNNILLIDGKPQWQHECLQCLACINYCPEESIQYGQRTIGQKRYHHPEITITDLKNQK
jgi:ferredoxin